ncbi:MAG: archaemetzincin family Zn-dependent metalloprotease [Methanomicrobiales archaeon]|nr:archaemetzincin family Zn-dependent metalloprotease [Methanomicrobiales archaeon]
MRETDILILWDSSAQRGLVAPLARTIATIFMLPTDIGESPLLLTGYNSSRHQYDAGSILTCLDTFRRRHRISALTLLILSHDIFIPDYSHVFGLARPTSGSAVVSSSRLSNGWYGLPDDAGELLDRLIKEGAHEVGHLLSLGHCRTATCIMYSPESIDDLQRKTQAFCGYCQSILDSRRSGICAQTYDLPGKGQISGPSP